MDWIDGITDKPRGDIETRAQFVSRNIHWWYQNRDKERVVRKPYYDHFLQYTGACYHMTNDSIVGEIGPGPFGGMIQVCSLLAKQKVFIDYAMRELFNLHFIDWPDNALFVNAPAENIPLKDDVIDVLVSYNALDHGWDIYAAIQECLRIARQCFLSFDCRGNNPSQRGDIDHHQLLRIEDIRLFAERELSAKCEWTLSDLPMPNKTFPVAILHLNRGYYVE
jgi:SAM-dependent methyltransferase